MRKIVIRMVETSVNSEQNTLVKKIEELEAKLHENIKYSEETKKLLKKKNLDDKQKKKYETVLENLFKEYGKLLDQQDKLKEKKKKESYKKSNTKEVKQINTSLVSSLDTKPNYSAILKKAWDSPSPKELDTKVSELEYRQDLLEELKTKPEMKKNLKKIDLHIKAIKDALIKWG